MVPTLRRDIASYPTWLTTWCSGSPTVTWTMNNINPNNSKPKGTEQHIPECNINQMTLTQSYLALHLKQFWEDPTWLPTWSVLRGSYLALHLNQFWEDPTWRPTWSSSERILYLALHMKQFWEDPTLVPGSPHASHDVIPMLKMISHYVKGKTAVEPFCNSRHLAGRKPWQQQQQQLVSSLV